MIDLGEFPQVIQEVINNQTELLAQKWKQEQMEKDREERRKERKKEREHSKSRERGKKEEATSKSDRSHHKWVTFFGLSAFLYQFSCIHCSVLFPEERSLRIDTVSTNTRNIRSTSTKGNLSIDQGHKVVPGQEVAQGPEVAQHPKDVRRLERFPGGDQGLDVDDCFLSLCPFFIAFLCFIKKIIPVLDLF